MKIKLFFFVLLIILSHSILLSHDEVHKIHLFLQGKQYEELEMKLHLDGREKYFITGISENGFDWSFDIPDSIFQKYEHLEIGIPAKADTIVHLISFNILTEYRDTLTVGSLNVPEGETIINAKFHKFAIEEKVLFFHFKDFHNDVFIVSSEDVPSLYEAAKLRNSWYGWFRKGKDEPEYSQQIEEYIQCTKKSPDSHQLISTFAANLKSYKTKSDIESIFNCFSDGKKQSYFGKKVQDYLSAISFDHFENSTLLRWDTHEPESIINDSLKYNLIIFSASWCAPCHKLIPLLKEVYEDLKGNLEMIYVSIDDSETVRFWAELMEKENIPWRSVLAVNNVKEVSKQYRVNGIPYCLLVHPGGKMEEIELRNPDDKKRVYELINSQK